jgi:hypothetical protein
VLVTAYLNGQTAGHSADHERTPGRRDVVKGWTSAAVRRHTKWLYSIDASCLRGQGYAVTLTVRDCPSSAGEWHALRRRFIKRLERAGLIRFHWVTEWQRRGVPHMHGALYWDDLGLLDALALVLRAWLDVAAAHRPAAGSQDVKRIDGATGWLQYLSKHASRGVKHYQRSGHPEGWDKTGRLWGYGGEWPVVEPMQFDLDRHAGYRYRRLIRAWTVADARATGDPARIAWARRMLTCSDPKLSPVRGVSGWVPESVSVALVALLAEQGEGVIQRVENQEGAPGSPAA